LKKLSILFLVLLFVFNGSFPHSVFAGAPALPPEIINPVTCPGGTAKCYYAKNPNSPKPNLRLVEPRLNPTPTTFPTKIGNVAGMFFNMFLSTPQGQKLISDGGSKVDDAANYLGNYIQKLSDVEKNGFIASYDAFVSGSTQTIELGSSLYNSFVKYLDNGMLDVDKANNAIEASDHSYTFTGFETGVGMIPASQMDWIYNANHFNITINHVIGSVKVINSTSYKLWFVGSSFANGNFGSYDVYKISFTDGIFQLKENLFSSTTSYSDVVDKGYSLYITNFNQNLSKGTDNNYKPSTSDSSYFNLSNGSIIAPHFPDNNIVPAIVENDSSTKYWEIPAPYEDGQENSNYVPVSDPAAKAEPAVIIIDESGYEVDPKTGEVSADPVTEPIPIDDGRGGSTPPEDPTENKIKWSKLAPAVAAMARVFPFSIPWDFYDFFSQFNVKPVTPVFDMKADRTIVLGGKSIPINFDWKIDFSIFDVVAKICRWGLIICFDIYVITSLRKYTPD
jgi:hypothetical protein